MAKAWENAAEGKGQARPRDWRKRMSDNIAYALLAYTGLQIYVTMGQLHSNTGSLLPYFTLVLLVVAIIPACRRFERRWARLSNDQAIDPAYAGQFRRDQVWLWAMALGLPFLVTGLFRGLAALAG
jgi:hypothetical protein